MSYPVADEKGAGYPPDQQQGYPPQQPTGYPPQQVGYPPQQQQPGYPPQQQPGYPPQQAGYPPQQAGYPPQQAGYPPQQAGYPPQQSEFKTDAPPPYYPGQQPPMAQQQPAAAVQQQTSTNVVVVSQPATPYYSRVVHPTGDHFLTLSIVLTVLCCLCGTWYSLFCTIPAIIFATQARDADARGDVAGARRQGYIALGCNIAACVWWIVALVIIIGIAAGINATGGSSYYYSYCRYSYYSYYCNK